jgi:Family of unknown function (DUF5946)
MGAARTPPAPAGDKLPCPDCGALIDDVEEVRTDHFYAGASAGCWLAYTELIGRQMSDPALAEARMLSVDVYMAQHPGTFNRQAAQSVWVHLVGMCLSLEHGYDAMASIRAKARLAAPDARFEWLEPPADLGPITVLDVLATATATDHASAVDKWARTVWEAWSPHHSAIRSRAGHLAATLR